MRRFSQNSFHLTFCTNPLLLTSSYATFFSVSSAILLFAMREYPRVRMVGDEQSAGERAGFRRFVRDAWRTNKKLPETWKTLFSQHELEKTEKELALISIADRVTSAFCTSHEGSAIHLNPSKIHIVSQANLQEVDALSRLEGGGISFPIVGQIVLVSERARKHEVGFLRILAHELIHIKSYLSTNTEGLRRRAGFVSELSSGDSAFEGLDEALTEEAAFDCLIQSMQDPVFSSMIAPVFSAEGRRARRDYAKKIGAPPGEVLWARTDLSDGGHLTYFTQRQALFYLTKTIASDHPDRFSSHQDVLDLFFRAKFQGNMIAPGRLIEGSFGKGSMRYISSMPGDEDVAASYLEGLRERRRQHLHTTS